MRLMTKKTKIKLSNVDLFFTIINHTILSLCLLVVIYPLIYIVSSSFSSVQAVASGRVWLLPVEPNFTAYTTIFKNDQIVTGFVNSIFYTVVGTTINIIMTIMAGYPLSRKDFYGKGAITVLFTFTMLFSGGMIPSYLLIQNLGMMNTRWAMIIPGALSVWNVIIARTFFKTNIPEELYEAAQLDGCEDVKFIIEIVIPLSKAIISVLAVFYAVGHWNSYFGALLYLRDPKKFPLQIILRRILIDTQFRADMIEDIKAIEIAQGLKELLKYSLMVVASAPVLIVYAFAQKHFIKGIMVGSLKG
jgi:putative aldouronate transport system permease protein